MLINMGSLATIDLVRVRAKALRHRVWFRVLSPIERGLVSAVIKVVDEVRSRLLKGVLRSIMQKLADALESSVSRIMRTLGYPLACKISLLAQSWGNDSAKRWQKDQNFARYLAIVKMNESPLYNP